MNTVLIQELLRYNNLLQIIRRNLNDTIKACDGLIVMTSEMERAAESMINNIVPSLWLSKSYPSLKPLMSYHADLIQRVAMFNKWISEQEPLVFWISGFYFTQSFFTGVMQKYSRKHQIPIDKLSFDFKVIEQ